MLATQIRKRAIIAVIGRSSATAPINGSLHGERKMASGGYGFPGPDVWWAGCEPLVDNGPPGIPNCSIVPGYKVIMAVQSSGGGRKRKGSLNQVVTVSPSFWAGW